MAAINDIIFQSSIDNPFSQSNTEKITERSTYKGKKYYSIEKKYTQKINLSIASIQEISVYYGFKERAYFCEGIVNIASKKTMGLRKKIIYIDNSFDTEDSYINDYTDNVNININLNNQKVFTINNSSERKSFKVNLGDTLPPQIDFELALEGNAYVSNTKFSANTSLESQIISSPSISEETTKSLENLIVQTSSVKELTEKTIIESKTKTIHYKASVTSCNLSNLLITSLTDNTYEVSGDLSFDYLIEVFKTEKDEDKEDRLKYEKTTLIRGIDLIDTNALIDFKINNTFIETSVLTIQDSGTHSTNFSYNIGHNLNNYINFSISLEGKVELSEELKSEFSTEYLIPSVNSTIWEENYQIYQENSQEEASDDTIETKNYESNSIDYIKKVIELVNGKRLLVGIKDITIKTIEFQENFEYITKKYISKKPIQSVTLSVDEIIPDKFIFEEGLINKNKWIRYFISFNEIKWYEISPQERNDLNNVSLPPKKYFINKNLQGSIGELEELIEVEEQPKDIYLKIQMNRPKGIANLSPILKKYSIICSLME